MKQNEAKKALMKYFSQENNTVHFWGDRDAVMKIGNALSYGKIRFGDAPDMTISYNRTLYIVEHFEIDCFKRIRKGGSTYHIEKSRIDKKMINTEITENGVTIYDTINAESSYDFFEKNSISSFLKHYNQIPLYRQHILEIDDLYDIDDIKVVFLIEDVSPLGTTVFERSKGEMHPVILAESKEFLELLKSSNEVDCVITCSKVDKKDYIWIIDRNNIDAYFEHVKDYKRMDFLNFKPHIVSFKTLIPIEKEKKCL